MKRTILMVFWMVLMPFIVLAEDIIVLNNGDIVKSKVIEIGQNEVKYKKASNPNGPTYSINKTEILSITYENGEKEAFEEASRTGETPIQVSTDNQDLIKSYNIELPQRSGKSSNTITNHAWVYYGLKRNSVLSSNDVEISIGRIRDTEEYRRLTNNEETVLFGNTLYIDNLIKISNKTNHPLYIDLGNTFRVDSNENGSEGKPWYDGSIYSESQGSSFGGSLGLGSITNILGIGGVIGGLANGISVGGSNQNGVVVDKSIQRVMVIPPLSTIYLPGHPYVYGKKVLYEFERFVCTLKNGAKSRYNLKKWELREYDETTSPSNISYYITISSNQDFSQYQIYPVHLYTRALYGTSRLEGMNPKKYSIQNVEKFINGYVKLED